MSLLDNLLGKTPAISSNAEFWSWFQLREKDFYKVIKSHGNIEKKFFDKLSPALNQLREGYFFLVGMEGETTAELIITADGKIGNFVFVEELVASAPVIPGWKFTAHKPPLELKNVNIAMDKFKFGEDTLKFFPNENPEYPDEIDITIVHQDYNEEDRGVIVAGVYVFIDNHIGELYASEVIDNLNIEGPAGQPELIPIEKLKSYLNWRQKEFVEKYEGVTYDDSTDAFMGFEATLQSGNPALGIANTTILDWDRKASHPWLFTLGMKFIPGNGGLPDDATSERMDAIEDSLIKRLKSTDGYINVGRETAEGMREVYFICREFRRPPKEAEAVFKEHSHFGLTLGYTIYKDKYWRTFDRFRQ